MQTVERFRAAVEQGDLSAVDELFTPDVRFVSPVKFTPMQGLPVIRGLLTILLETFEDFRYVGVLEGEAEMGPDGRVTETHILIFRAKLADTQIHGIDLLQLGEDGRIEEFTVMVRPLSALNRLHEAVEAALIAGGLIPDPSGALKA